MNTLSRHDRRLLERILLDSDRPGDRLELSDAVLRAAIQGERRLTAQEVERLWVSPLTLRRFRFLSGEIRTASALGGWTGSRGLLLAAEGGDDPPSITTEDGCWTLCFLPGMGGKLRIIMKYTGAGDLAALMAAAGRGVSVRDGEGQVLLRGALDEDGELEAPWPLELSPRDHFRAIGGRFAVVPEPLTAGP